MKDFFARTEMLIGQGGLEKLKKSHVAVFGLGGVGSYAAEAIVRSGVGEITVVDSDTVAESNINRQLIAATSTIGRKKTEVAAERYLDINPSLKIHAKDVFVSEKTIKEFDFSEYDFVVDAIDTVSAKLLIICECSKKNIPIISSMGTGNKLDPSCFEICDIYKTTTCPLARVMRAELKKAGIEKLTVVCSREKPRKVFKTQEEPAPGRRSIPASIAFVPSVAGLMMAGKVITEILKM